MKLIPENRYIQVETERGNTWVETEGNENSKDCTYMGNETCGVVWTRGVMQEGRVAWVGGVQSGKAMVGKVKAREAWMGALPWGLPVQLLGLEHWQQQIGHWALHICLIAHQPHMGRYRQGVCG